MASTVVTESEEESGRVMGTRTALSAFVDVVAKMDLVCVSARTRLMEEHGGNDYLLRSLGCLSSQRFRMH